ncbi:MAG: hypothetical protein HC828_05600 [Blastochloris sp.]|nr:hypothetical protein [Blastochloris sp.]
MRRQTEGQALVVVALTMRVLVLLAIGVNAIQLERRTQARIHTSLDAAAHAALHTQAQTDWIDDTTMFAAHAAEARFRAVLAEGLTRVAAATHPDPATVARQASFQLVSAGDRCGTQDVTAPGVCASLTITTMRAMGDTELVVTTLAQAVEGG